MKILSFGGGNHNFGLFKNVQTANLLCCCIMVLTKLSSWWQVDDINAAVADLKAKNIRTLSAEPRLGAHGKPVMFLHPKDCDGVLVELEEA